MSPPSEDEPGNDFAATTLDREAMSFEDLEELAASPETSDETASEAESEAERDVVGPKWAGTLPGTDRAPQIAPVLTLPPAVVPEPEVVTPPPAVAPEEANLAATTLHQKIVAVDVPTEPPIDQLSADNRVADAGRAAGLRPGSRAPNSEDQLLKVGLVVVVVLIALLVVGVCAGVVSTLLEPIPSESPAALE